MPQPYPVVVFYKSDTRYAGHLPTKRVGDPVNDVPHPYNPTQSHKFVVSIGDIKHDDARAHPYTYFIHLTQLTGSFFDLTKGLDWYVFRRPYTSRRDS